MENELESFFRDFVHDHNVRERFEGRHRNYAERELHLVRKRSKPNIIANPKHNNVQIILITNEKRRNDQTRTIGLGRISRMDRTRRLTKIHNKIVEKGNFNMLDLHSPINNQHDTISGFDHIPIERTKRAPADGLVVDLPSQDLLPGLLYCAGHQHNRGVEPAALHAHHDGLRPLGAPGRGDGAGARGAGADRLRNPEFRRSLQ